MPNTKFSYEERVAMMAKKYKRNMRSYFVASMVFAFLAAVAMCILHFMLAYDFSFRISKLVMGVVVLILATASACFLSEAGYCSAVKFYEPELLRVEGEKKSAEERIDRHIDNYLQLVSFVKAKSPGLFAEFTEWQEKRPEK